MPKIKINDLPKNETISQKAMKQVLGGSLMTMSMFFPSSPINNGDGSSMIIRDFGITHRLTRGTDSKPWGEYSKSSTLFSNPNDND